MRNSPSAKNSLASDSEDAIRRQAVQAQLRLGGRRPVAVRCCACGWPQPPWSLRRIGVPACWQLGVVLGSLAASAVAVARIPRLGGRQMPVSLLALALVGGRVRARHADPRRRPCNSGWWLPLVFPLLAVPLVISAFWWIAAPTSEGRTVLDHIAGFKQYLSITERERLDRMTPPEDTPELFERYLPYAIALGVENRWAERFAGVLAAAAAQGQQGFAWYSGSSNPWDNPERLRRTASALRYRARSVRLRPRPARAAARAAAGRRAAAAAVAAAAAGRSAQAGRLQHACRARRDRCRLADRSKPSLPASFSDGSFAGAMIAQIGVGCEIGLGPVEHRAARFAGNPLAMRFAGEDPAHFRLLAEFGLDIAPGVEQAEHADQLAVGLALDRPAAEAESSHIADRGQQPPPAFLRAHRVGAEVAVDFAVLKDRVIRPKIVLAPRAQDQPLGLDHAALSRIESLLLAEGQPAEALVEARHLAAGSSSFWLPPVHAGCTFGSISRCIVSPSLPQVERTWNLVPSVISTLIM